ncbi:hypothetical protein D3C86_1743520 [compost metagenome]
MYHSCFYIRNEKLPTKTQLRYRSGDWRYGGRRTLGNRLDRSHWRRCLLDRHFLQFCQRHLRSQLIGATVDPVKNPLAIDTLQTPTEGLKQPPKRRISLKVHALYFH